MSRYITICQELLQEQYPSLHERLRRERRLLEALNRYAEELRAVHLAWMGALRRASPERDPESIASEAMELAIQHIEGDLPCESPPSGSEMESLSLDEAMASLRRATPRA